MFWGDEYESLASLELGDPDAVTLYPGGGGVATPPSKGSCLPEAYAPHGLIARTYSWISAISTEDVG